MTEWFCRQRQDYLVNEWTAIADDKSMCAVEGCHFVEAVVGLPFQTAAKSISAYYCPSDTVCSEVGEGEAHSTARCWPCSGSNSGPFTALCAVVS